MTVASTGSDSSVLAIAVEEECLLCIVCGDDEEEDGSECRTDGVLLLRVDTCSAL